ncbi:MAG TPA: VWA domain-containing protein [Gaiellaceae bacterium]|nr:VWA domain-containing protein [Gaiellaceae bacterium]
MSFLSPLGALVVLVAVVPLAAFVHSDRARRRVTRLLRLREPESRVRLLPLLASLAIAALIGVAATQPTLTRRSSQRVRTDAEAWFVLDTSLSMKASAGPRTPTRFQRAQNLAMRLRDELGDIPVGLASVTDRVLPHLFPTTDRDTFDLTVRKVMGIERPPPSDGFSTRITTLGSIARLVTSNFFAPTTKKRLLVVFTDGETKPFADASIGTVFRRPPGLHAIFVRIWGAHERIYDGRTVDPLYRPDPESADYIRQLAATSGGTAFDSRDFGSVVKTARAALGNGSTRVVADEHRRLALAPYLAGLCFLPLGFVLWRRNM